MSSSTEPITRTAIARKIGKVKGSNLKSIGISINTGIVTASPPNAGVSLSWRAFSGLSNSLFLLFVLGLYVIPNFVAIFPIMGNNRKESSNPKRNSGQ